MRRLVRLCRMSTRRQAGRRGGGGGGGGGQACMHESTDGRTGAAAARDEALSKEGDRPTEGGGAVFAFCLRRRVDRLVYMPRSILY